VRADLFEAAPIPGVDHIKVDADDNGVPVEYAVLCEGFDRLADDAKSAEVRIAFENTPFTHHVKTTEDAVAFVTQVGNPNGGLLLDIWHAYRGGTPYATLPAPVPRAIVFGVELDDGRAEWWAPISRTPSTTDFPAEQGFSTSPLSSTRCWRSAGMACGVSSTCPATFGACRCSTPSPRPETRHCTASIWQLNVATRI
jgi:hypothetical protein